MHRPFHLRAMLSLCLLSIPACSTGPSAGCELRLTGAVQYASSCAPVTFKASSGWSFYGDTIPGPPSVAIRIGAGPAPSTFGFGPDDGDSWSISVTDSSGSWVGGTAGFSLRFTAVQRIKVVGDTTYLGTHGALTATLVPVLPAAAGDTITLHMTF